ncbi:MAG: DUF748 domain-containing protein [Candidatus Omnitrophota bacterium]
MKKLLIVIVILTMAGFLAVNVVAQRAPDLLKKTLESALNKTVKIRTIDYRFPGTFELQGFVISEKEGPFKTEPLISAEHILLDVSPISLSRKSLIIDRIEIRDAHIAIRKWQNYFYQPFDEAIHHIAEVPAPKNIAAAPVNAKVPLEIRLLKIQNGVLRFMDYDVQSEGFVIALTNTQITAKNLTFPFGSKRTTYTAEGTLPQGRDERAAEFRLSGWTVIESLDTDALITVRGVHLPYFKPYYNQVVGAVIDDGYMDARAWLQIGGKRLISNVDFEFSQLLFSQYESEDQLFGLKADEILSFMKDSAGRLKFQIAFDWNMAEKNVRLKDSLRKSFEKSLKKTVLGNVGNIIANTLQKIGDGSLSKDKEGIDGKIKKIKDFFKY